MPVLESLCSLADYSIASEETSKNQTLRFSFFCVFFVSRGNLLDFDCKIREKHNEGLAPVIYILRFSTLYT